MKWTVCVGTLFPELFPGPLGVSCAGRGLADNKWSMEIDDLRDFAKDKHKTVDDMVFGGNGGMLIKCDIVDRWCQLDKNQRRRKVFMSPRGKRFNQAMVDDLIKEDLCILCGRYEGVDVRVLEHHNFDEISIGDFVLYGGEVAAMVLLEACTRSFVVPEAYQEDSFANQLLECDHYTRPAEWITADGQAVYKVPEVLLSGNHAKIREWQKQNALDVTQKRRPDLIEPNLEG
jgi:tRNA (guanine37-N1)-methyltransferase